MKILEERRGEVVVIRPDCAQLNAPVAGDFKRRVATIVDGGDHRLVLDLQDVEFVDSTGLGAIVSVLKSVDATGYLRLCHASKTVRVMLEVTHMTRILPIHDDVTSAMRGTADAAP